MAINLEYFLALANVPGVGGGEEREEDRKREGGRERWISVLDSLQMTVFS